MHPLVPNHVYLEGIPICKHQHSEVEWGWLLSCRLVEQFGSTRRKRQLTAKENAVVRADAVGGAEALQDMLKSAADRAAEANMTKDDIIKQTQALRAIPPHHPEATKPHDAYRCAFSPPKPAVIWHLNVVTWSQNNPSELCNHASMQCCGFAPMVKCHLCCLVLGHAVCTGAMALLTSSTIEHLAWQLLNALTWPTLWLVACPASS